MTPLHIPKAGLNISRSELPQVKSTDVPDYLRWLSQHKHLTSTRTEMPVSALHPSQGNFNQSKIRAFMSHKREELRKPVIISGDYFLIDGHHRWLALLNMDVHDTIPVIMVHTKVLDLIAATKEYPKSFTRTVVESFSAITEASEKHTVISFGRFNPPTAGHKKLVDKVHEVAKEHHAAHQVILSHSHDSKKNPLHPKDKLKHALRAFPGTDVKVSSPKHPTIFHHAALFHKSGTQHLHVVAGGDRVKEFHDTLHKYNGKFNKDGQGYKFKSITVHSAGNRDPNAKGTEGMSASKMREHAGKGDFKSFKQGVPSTMSHGDTKELYHDVRKGMGHLNEAAWVGPYDKSFENAHPVARAHGFVEYTNLHSSVGGKAYVHKDNSNYQLTISGKGHWIHNYKEGDGAIALKQHLSKYHKQEMKEEVEHLAEGVHDAGIFKAVFITGGTGSGKDFIMKKSLHGHGLTEINSDTAFEHLLGKRGLSKHMPEGEKGLRDEARDRAKSVTDLRQRLAIHGRNGLIINSTGANHDQIKKLKGALEELGYDSKMVFVDASDNVSRNRNIERGQRGGRAIPEELRAKKWREAQDSRVAFSKMFGQEHYHEFNNDEDLRHNTDPEIHSQKTAELDDLFKTVRKFTQKPPEHPAAQEWVQRNLGKLAKRPIGNKKQQSRVIPQSSDSQTSEQARKLGLQYYGHGQYGKMGRVSHFSLHGSLIEKKKALKPVKPVEPPKAPKKKLDESFEELFTEENDYAYRRLEDCVDSERMVGEIERESGESLYHSELQPTVSETRVLVPASEVDYRDLGDYGSSQEIQEAPQEKVSFGSFRRRLVVYGREENQETTQTLNEGEPVLEPGTEPGAILGTGTNELHDGSNLGKATSGPKKTLRTFKKDIK